MRCWVSLAPDGCADPARDRLGNGLAQLHAEVPLLGQHDLRRGVGQPAPLRAEMFHVEVALAQQPRLDDFQLLILEVAGPGARRNGGPGVWRMRKRPAAAWISVSSTMREAASSAQGNSFISRISRGLRNWAMQLSLR